MVANAVIPATWEAEAGELLELGRRRLQSAEFVPLHSSLGNKQNCLIHPKTFAAISDTLFSAWNIEMKD